MTLELVQETIRTNLNQEALDEFIEHRIELKKKMTPLAIKKATKMLCKHGYEHQQYMVDRAILSGWTGIWEVEPQVKQTSRQTTLQEDLTNTDWAH